MPIPDEVLAEPRNAHLALSSQATLRQAFALLCSPQVNGAAWWHLIAARKDGTWTFGKFADLFRIVKTQDADLDTRLDKLDWLSAAQVIAQNSVETRDAEDMARRAPGQVLVVIDGAELAGILYVGTRRGSSAEAVSTSALMELAGDLADLKEFSSLLIKKRQPRPKTPPPKE